MLENYEMFRFYSMLGSLCLNEVALYDKNVITSYSIICI